MVNETLKTESEHLIRNDWADDVKDALNSFIDNYGNSSPFYDDSAYVVFDFDNTISVFDVEEQLAIYQLQHMAFEITPDGISDVISTGLSGLDKDIVVSGNGKASYSDWISDISSAYEKLVAKYGQFTASGLSDEDSIKIQHDDDWKEFSVKMRALYDVIADNESPSVAYPWITYWFTGMTHEDIYNLAYRSHLYFSSVETSEVIWSSPDNYNSRAGHVEYTWTSGVQVTENIKELIRLLDENGIHVWICSASFIDAIRAAVDFFGLHDHISGVLALTNKFERGRMVNEYDYDTGYGCIPCCGSDKWTEDIHASGAQTQFEGKVTAVNNTLAVKYGHGPSAGFMDSACDFNFCTEYASLKLVVCFNRADRKITDGGGLIAELAVYQKGTLGYNLDSANKAGDTFYVLQGRDENGMRTFRSSNQTIRIGSREEKLFCSEDNYKQLQYMTDNAMTSSEILNVFSFKTDAEDKDNLLGIKYGFLNKYNGYHSIEI